MSTRVLLDEAGTADSSKSLQSEDSFINAFLKNASFSDASSSEDEGVLESYPEEEVESYSKEEKDHDSATGVDSVDPTEYMYQYNSSSSQDGSHSKNSNTENSAFSNNQMDSSRFSETSSMTTGISTASDSQINSVAETSSVFVDEDGYSTQSETATENSSVFPMAEETNGNQQQRNNVSIKSINNDGDDNISEMDGDNETVKEGDLNVHYNGLKDGDESFMTDGNTTNNDNMTHGREDDSIYEGRSYKLAREASNPILDEISDSQKDEISLESIREQPLCYTICGCGPSEYMPTNEIKVSKSKISNSLQQVQSDLSDSSGDMSEAKRRGRRDKAGESKYIKKLPSFHRMQKFIEQVSSKSFGAVDSNKEDEIDRNSTEKVKYTEESNGSSSQNFEENMDKEESSRTLSENDLGTSTRAMEELGIDRDFLISISKDNDGLNSISADEGSNNTDLKRLQSEVTRNEDIHKENRCNILECLEASFNDVTNCFSRMICHDEDEDLDLLIELEMREKLLAKSISDSNMSPIPKLLRDKVKLPGQKHRKERNKIEKRSDAQSEEVFNESFGNDSLFDRSFFSVGNDGQILLSPKNRDEVIQRREEMVVIDDPEENLASEIKPLPDNTKSDQDLSKIESQSGVLDLRDIIIQQEQNSIRNLDSSYMSDDDDDDDDDDDGYGQNRGGHYNSHEAANEEQYPLSSNAYQVDMRDIVIEQEISINPSCMHDNNKSYISDDDDDDNEGDNSDQGENDYEYEEHTGHTGIHSTISPVQLSDSKKNFHDDASYMSSSSDESSDSDSLQQHRFRRNLRTSEEYQSNTIMLGSDNIHEKTRDLRDIIIQQEKDFITKKLGSSDISDKIIDKVETERDPTRIHVDKESNISNLMTIEKSISTGINTASARLNDDSSYMSSSSSSSEESFPNDTSIMEEESLSQIQNIQFHDSFQSSVDLRDVIIKQEEENIKTTDSSYFSDEDDDDDDNEGDIQDRNGLSSQIDNETFLDVRDIIIEQESTMNPALVTDCNASYFSDDDEEEDFDDQFVDTSSSNVLKSFSYNEYGKENAPSWDVPLDDPENIDFVQNASDQNIGDSYVESSSGESIQIEKEPLQNVLSLRSNENRNLSLEKNHTSKEPIERIKSKQNLLQTETKVGEVNQSVNLKPSDDHIYSAADTERLATITSTKKETGSISVETAKNKGTAALVSAAQNLISKAQVKLTVQNDLAVLQQKVLEKQKSIKEERTETEESSLINEKKSTFEVSTNEELTDTNIIPKIHISPDTSSVNLDERRKRIAERRARLAKLRLAIEESANKGTDLNESLDKMSLQMTETREVDSDVRSTSPHEDRTQDSVSSADREEEMKPTNELKSDDFSDQSEEQHSKVWLSRVNSNLNAKAHRRELMKKKFQRQLQRAKATP